MFPFSILNRGPVFTSCLHALDAVRFATKKAGGSTRNGRDSIGRRLGLKKTGGQPVISGNILIRQRGQKYRAGENVGMGRDHTLWALKDGRVEFQWDAAIKRNFVHVK